MISKTSIVPGNIYEVSTSRYLLGEYLGKMIVEYGCRPKCKCHLSPSIEVFQFTNGNFTQTIFDTGLVLKTNPFATILDRAKQ